MVEDVEISELDLRYEPLRIKNPQLEREMLLSIRERGIEEPLLGVDSPPKRLLLDGFKRLRCARSVGLHHLPYEARGTDPALGILSLLRVRPYRPLTILEQASFLEELRLTHSLGIAQIAQLLSRSKGWVSLRLGLCEELRPAVREKLFNGQFPAYAYLYHLRPFMRINRGLGEQVERFVLALSGQGLSVRQIALLSRACFGAGSSPLMAEEILAGRFEMLLWPGKEGEKTGGCTPLERRTLQELARIRDGMRRVLALAGRAKMESLAFQGEGGLLWAGIRKESKAFLRLISLGRLKRCGRVKDEPGGEMQHDTSIYQVRLEGGPIRAIASLLYLRYSKRRYLKFYPSFNRFRMKCFFHEALTYWGYAAPVCIIDNTNLARLGGLGHQAIIVPEMAHFARQYGFTFQCHEVGHANRKAGDERSFYTVQTNFLPGRTFHNWEDINGQAREWATVRMEHRPQGKARLIPAKAFEDERGFLIPVSPHLCPPYLDLGRLVDQYGYIACDGNYYWVPGDKRGQVKVLRFDQRLEIYAQGKLLVTYDLPPEGTKGKIISPKGQPQPPYQPRSRKQPTMLEEKRLRAMGETVKEYLEFALPAKGIERHRLLRALYLLSSQISPKIFEKTLGRALRFRITNLGSLRRMALLLLTQNGSRLPCVQIDEDFQDRESYQEGRMTDGPDLSVYERMLGDAVEPSPEEKENSHEE